MILTLHKELPELTTITIEKKEIVFNEQENIDLILINKTKVISKDKLIKSLVPNKINIETTITIISDLKIKIGQKITGKVLQETLTNIHRILMVLTGKIEGKSNGKENVTRNKGITAISGIETLQIRQLEA